MEEEEGEWNKKELDGKSKSTTGDRISFQTPKLVEKVTMNYNEFGDFGYTRAKFET